MSASSPCYLLTDRNGRSLRGTDIRTGRFVQSPHRGEDLISCNVWECASSPQLAVMINSLHAAVSEPRLFEIHHFRLSLVSEQAGLNLRVRELRVPTVTATQKLAFAIRVVRALHPRHPFFDWGARWLSGRERGAVAARLALASLSEAGHGRDSHEDFARRAREVIAAALLWVRQGKEWERKLAECVGTAVAGLPDSPAMHQCAILALEESDLGSVAGDATSRTSPHRIIRRREAPQSSRSPTPDTFTRDAGTDAHPSAAPEGRERS